MNRNYLLIILLLINTPIISAITDIPGYRPIKAMWYSSENQFINNTYEFEFMHNNSINYVLDAFGKFYKYSNNNLSYLIYNSTLDGKRYNITYCVIFQFSLPQSDAPFPSENGTYYGSYSGTMKRSDLVPPLSRAYWRYMTDVFKNITLNMSGYPDQKVNCLGFDFEAYEVDDEDSYYTYQGSYDNETFKEFYNNLSEPPPEPNWTERRNWLIFDNKLEEYQAFLANKSYTLAKQMYDEVSAINPEVFFVEYPSPVYSQTYNTYVYDIVLDALNAWDEVYPPILFATDTFINGSERAMPSEISQSSGDYIKWTRRDTGQIINMYYSAGFLLNRYDPNFTSNNLSGGIYQTGIRGNGFWLFKEIHLFYPCQSVPNNGYYLRMDCKNQNSSSAPNVCYNNSDLNDSYWDSQCVLYQDQAKSDYWGAIKSSSDSIDLFFNPQTPITGGGGGSSTSIVNENTSSNESVLKPPIVDSSNSSGYEVVMILVIITLLIAVYFYKKA